jgi:hypothetical protein
MPRRLKYRSKPDNIIYSYDQCYTGHKSDSVRNICFVQKDYLTLLIQNKLIEFVREEKMFRITDGGINALNIFDEMDKLLPLQFTDH